jgi:hypothetical protein
MSLGDAGQDQGGNLDASTIQYYLRGVGAFPAGKEEVAEPPRATVLRRTWSPRSGTRTLYASTALMRSCRRCKKPLRRGRWRTSFGSGAPANAEGRV